VLFRRLFIWSSYCEDSILEKSLGSLWAITVAKQCNDVFKLNIKPPLFRILQDSFLSTKKQGLSEADNRSVIACSTL